MGKLAVLLLATHAAWAQYVVNARAGTVNYSEGEVFLNGQPAPATPLKFPELRPGQELRTDNGRVEVLLGPGVFLRLGEHGALRMLDSRLENTQVEIQQGEALFEVVQIANDSGLHVIAGATRTSFKGMGLYRFDRNADTLRVYGGRAEVVTGGQRVEAGRGSMVRLGNTLPLAKFDLRDKDQLHQWAASRSFLLYRHDLEAHSRSTNWEVTRITRVPNKLGLPSDSDLLFASNRDFGVMFDLKSYEERQFR